ncbi:aromatic-ring-hydroxylating dioxygenase subunit beta [Exilibacterium tricleocarpae]|uniref:Aromatic-ring-hydroxylating dioxygenase subunit beta n=1 Tax=Exilibacterium tricleocarpae TaxID=2591008 RepID=A0A545TNU5_9GAMM|nr:aromatic-ring-hydroxylating dioxygenase subunit beta [Exilibacterium tricleocarpae]TQV78841.1 aromatic-ring-hydroxylating dioxygenase subunit beta [Exilibacterium tricleocarpae]
MTETPPLTDTTPVAGPAAPVTGPAITAATATPAGGVDLAEIERFLYREADLLDGNDLENWMQLFTDDGTYWMPVAPDQQDPHSHISILFENRTLMAVRAANFGHRLSASMQYTIRTSHLISNIRLAALDTATGTCTVKSNFQAVLYYREQTLFAGTYTHNLVRAGDEYKIRQKRVDIINCDANHKSIMTYI